MRKKERGKEWGRKHKKHGQDRGRQSVGQEEVMGTRRMEWSGGIRETGREEWKKEGEGG